MSAFTATRLSLRAVPDGESTGRLFAGVLAPFLMEPHTGSATIFFGTILAVVAIGTFISLGFGRQTVGQLETVNRRHRGSGLKR